VSRRKGGETGRHKGLCNEPDLAAERRSLGGRVWISGEERREVGASRSSKKGFQVPTINNAAKGAEEESILSWSLWPPFYGGPVKIQGLGKNVGQSNKKTIPSWGGTQ